MYLADTPSIHPSVSEEEEDRVEREKEPLEREKKVRKEISGGQKKRKTWM